jgi:hypothetical protein
MRFFILTGIALALAACASTRIQSSWRDPAYAFSGTKSVLVMGVAKEEGPKRVLEDSFVKELAERGIQGIPSYTMQPVQGTLDQAGWERLMKERGIQGLLVSRLTDVKTVERDVAPTTTVVNTGGGGPSSYTSGYHGSTGYVGTNNGYPYANNWYGYYSNSYQVINQPGYTITEKFAVVETKFFDVTNNKMVWTGLSDTQMGVGSADALIRQFARVVAQAIYQ